MVLFSVACGSNPVPVTLGEPDAYRDFLRDAHVSRQIDSLFPGHRSDYEVLMTDPAATALALEIVGQSIATVTCLEPGRWRVQDDQGLDADLQLIRNEGDRRWYHATFIATGPLGLTFDAEGWLQVTSTSKPPHVHQRLDAHLKLKGAAGALFGWVLSYAGNAVDARLNRLTAAARIVAQKLHENRATALSQLEANPLFPRETLELLK